MNDGFQRAGNGLSEHAGARLNNKEGHSWGQGRNFTVDDLPRHGLTPVQPGHMLSALNGCGILIVSEITTKR